MSDELVNRLQRIYASIDATREFDMTRLPAGVFRSEKTVCVHQDFGGKLTEHQMVNAAHCVIHNIANLQDHLRKWMEAGGGDKGRVDNAFKSSVALRIIKDLSNNDKHGHPPRKAGGHSGMSPRLVNIRGQLKLTVKGGGTLMMTLGASGSPKVSGDGTAMAVITGDIIDKDGNVIGGLYEMELQATRVWESLLKDLGVL